MNIILSENVHPEGRNAGNKARMDVEKIICQMGYKHIVLYKSKCKFYVMLETFCALFRTCIYLEKKDYLVVEHPYTPYSYVRILSLFCHFLKIVKKANTIVIIHDLNSIRYNKFSIKKEVNDLNRYSHIICHNNKMKNILTEAGCTTNIKLLELFDYLLDSENTGNVLTDNSIVIAGNLCKEKCGYIYEFSDNYPLKIRLYGEGIENVRIASCLTYDGAFSPDELPNLINGKYGLVWDGDSADGCKGEVGNYLKYNTPHKTSLYIAANMPVIVWNESAISDYIIKRGIGITIENLIDLPSILAHISEAEYQQMKYNVQEVRKEIVYGRHLQNVITQIIKET